MRLACHQFLPLDYPEAQIDQLGAAELRDKARAEGFVLTGDVERVGDDPVVVVEFTGPDGGPALMHYPVGHPLVGADAEPAGRLVRWEADAEPVPRDNPVVVAGEGHSGLLSRGVLPSEVTENGGLVQFKHGLTGAGAIIIRAYDDAGTEVGYSFSVEISDGEHEIVLPAGVARLEAIREVSADNSTEAAQ